MGDLDDFCDGSVECVWSTFGGWGGGLSRLAGCACALGIVWRGIIFRTRKNYDDSNAGGLGGVEDFYGDGLGLIGSGGGGQYDGGDESGPWVVRGKALGPSSSAKSNWAGDDRGVSDHGGFGFDDCGNAEGFVCAPRKFPADDGGSLHQSDLWMGGGDGGGTSAALCGEYSDCGDGGSSFQHGPRWGFASCLYVFESAGGALGSSDCGGGASGGGVGID